MAYVEAPNRIDYFAYHEWADTPARMMLSLLERRLDASGLFRAVMTTSGAVIPDLRLDTKIFTLQQVFDSTGSRAEIRAKIMLYDIEASELLLAKTFELSEPADASNPEAGVAAANRAVERLLSELIDTIQDKLEDIPCTRAE